jgi:hypothetical protein
MYAIRIARALIAALLVALAVCGCATTQARVERGASFATAGIAYVDALPAVFDESFRLSVEANTHQLLLAREDLEFDTEDETREMRAEALSTADELLTKRLQLLRNLQKHALLLREYFMALHALMANDAATGINSSVQNVINSLNELRPGIADASIGDASVSDLLGPATSLAVGVYTNAALTNELRERGAVIERELALQEELLNALVEDMQHNAETIVLIEELNPVFTEFVEASRISDSWNDRRVAAYKRTVSLSSYDDIRKAAATMHASWVALVENRGTEEAFDLLLRDVDEMLAVARLFKSEK